MLLTANKVLRSKMTTGEQAQDTGAAACAVPGTLEWDLQFPALPSSAAGHLRPEPGPRPPLKPRLPRQSGFLPPQSVQTRPPARHPLEAEVVLISAEEKTRMGLDLATEIELKRITEEDLSENEVYRVLLAIIDQLAPAEDQLQAAQLRAPTCAEQAWEALKLQRERRAEAIIAHKTLMETHARNKALKLASKIEAQRVRRMTASERDSTGMYPPPPTQLVYPPPHLTHMYPPPRMTHLYSPPRVTHMYPPPHVCHMSRVSEL
jgi:hypothetical protein